MRKCIRYKKMYTHNVLKPNRLNSTWRPKLYSVPVGCSRSDRSQSLHVSDDVTPVTGLDSDIEHYYFVWLFPWYMWISVLYTLGDSAELCNINYLLVLPVKIYHYAKIWKHSKLKFTYMFLKGMLEKLEKKLIWLHETEHEGQKLPFRIW